MSSSQSQKILILAEHFAPAYKAGGIVRSLENMVRELEGNFDFWIVTGNANLSRK
jgi:hypothetical protein